jgi:hypothetical protein
LNYIIRNRHSPLRPVFCVRHFFHYCDKTPDRNNLREERLILAHDFRSFGPPMNGRVWQSKGPHIITARKEGEREKERGEKNPKTKRERETERVSLC